MGSLMLLDTASLYYRAFFGVPETVRAPDGTPVNAIRGLLDMISRLVRARHPARLVACLDADWRPAFRVAAVPSYKAHRLAAGIEAGMVFVNGMVTSYPELPFGGVKESGYGRELTDLGMHEFVNIKTVWVG